MEGSVTQLVIQGTQSIVSRTVDDIEMGILDDGATYVSGRALARMCGVDESTIRDARNRWDAGTRNGPLMKFLVGAGVGRTKLALDVIQGGQTITGYPEDVVIVLLEYYAIEAPGKNPEIALKNYRTLARVGLRKFVYAALGYDPTNAVPKALKHYHDRVMLSRVPSGYFGVFRESAEFLLTAIQSGLDVGPNTVPDQSIGAHWAKHWEERDFEQEYGPRDQHPHYYPDDFPQAKSNPQQMNVYPIKALGDFRAWMEDVYIPLKYPEYLKNKVSRGSLAPSTAQILLSAMSSLDSDGNT